MTFKPTPHSGQLILFTIPEPLLLFIIIKCNYTKKKAVGIFMTEETLVVSFIINPSPCLSAFMYTEPKNCILVYIYDTALCCDDVTPVRMLGRDNLGS